jgi:tRNA(fMet)-specific endonuclease VapC
MLDSTVLIQAERNRHSLDQLIERVTDSFGETDLSVSVISVGELLHGMWRAKGAAKREERRFYIQQIIDHFVVADVTLPIVRVFGRVNAELHRLGTPIATSDLLIACTAIHRGDEIATGNLRHFRRIPGLTVHEFA